MLVRSSAILLLSLVCLTTGAIGTHGQAAERKAVRVPLAKGGLLILPTVINKSSPANFEFDTGTSYGFVSDALVVKLGLRPDPALQNKPVTFNGQSVGMVKIDDMVVGGLILNGDFLVVKADQIHPGSSSGPDGLIGVTAFRSTAVAIFPRSQGMVLYNPGGLSPSDLTAAGFGPASYQVPISWDEARKVWTCQVSLTQGDKTRTEQLIVDTGSNGTLISAATADALALHRCGQAAPAFRPGLKPASTRPMGRVASRACVRRPLSAILQAMSKADQPKPGKPERYWTGAHTTHRVRYHLVFVPKYRKRVLRGGVASRLEALIRQACAVNGWEMEELAVQPDHVHLLIQAQPRFSVSQIVNTLKGGTSRVLRAEFPDLEEYLWGKSFWADGYFAATVGVVEGSVITAYIRNQQR